VRFNPVGLFVFVAFFVLISLALSRGSATTHVAEAIVTVLIVMGVGGAALRKGSRSRGR
jgi:hypothetical protein